MLFEPRPHKYLLEPLNVMGWDDLTKVGKVDGIGVGFAVHVSIERPELGIFIG
jgi:hypothetical protein